MSARMLMPIVACTLVLGPARSQQPQQEELVVRVKKSIDRGVAFLRREQAADGGWERGGIGGVGFTTGGQSCLAMLTLLNAGVPPNDPVVQAGLKYVRNLPAQGTYVVGLQTMVLAEIGEPKDLFTIQRNVNFLLSSMDMKGRFVGWSYGPALRGGGDFSNTQYALLGLHAAKLAGAKFNCRMRPAGKSGTLFATSISSRNFPMALGATP